MITVLWPQCNCLVVLLAKARLTVSLPLRDWLAAYAMAMAYAMQEVYL